MEIIICKVPEAHALYQKEIDAMDALNNALRDSVDAMEKRVDDAFRVDVSKLELRGFRGMVGDSDAGLNCRPGRAYRWRDTPNGPVVDEVSRTEVHVCAAPAGEVCAVGGSRGRFEWCSECGKVV